jgi:hypothetical protein
MTLVLAGCATAPLKPAVEAQAVDSFGAPAPAECAAQPSSGNGVTRLGRALGYGALGVFLGALQGASNGAGWGLVAGGSWSEGALIGAGARLGFLIGFTAGLVKAGSGFSGEPAASPACPPALAETTVAAEDNTERAGTK